MAFQPIVNVVEETVYAYEALVRGITGASAATVLSQVTTANRYSFDQGCRVQAILLAAKLDLLSTGAKLAINFMPKAVYSPLACLQLTLQTADEVGFPCDRLIFEITEDEEVQDVAHLSRIVEEYHRWGFKMALDDFGSGYSGLNLLAGFHSDIIKLDMALTRNLSLRPAALTIVKQMVRLAKDLKCVLIAEGVETAEEYKALRRCGVVFMQGYLFARPAFEALPTPDFSALHPNPKGRNPLVRLPNVASRRIPARVAS